MNNHTTADEILTDLEGRLDNCTHKGDTTKAMCPAHDDTHPSLDIKIGDNGDCVLVKCWAGCETDAVLDALGMTMSDLFATDDACRSHITYEWLDHATGATVKQTRHFGGNDKYRWETGTKKAALVYLSDRYHRDATRPIIWTEGAKAADAAAAKLPADDYDVIGFPDSTTIPSAATLAEIAKGRPCIVWGDYDEPGAKVARRLVSALRQAGADVVTIVDPERLGLTAGRHDDAAEWRPGKDPKGDFEAACATVQLEEASPVPMDTSEQVRLWAEELKNDDLDGKRRILRTIAAAPEWQQLAVDMRIEVVGGLSKQTDKSIATVILGRFNDLTGVWREPQGGTVTTSEPDVVSLETLLADPLEPTDVVARGLAFGGCLGFIHGPKASGKTTILAAAAARVSQGQPWAGHDTEAGTVLVVTDDDPRSWTLALRDFGADTTRILMARARVVSRPGKLAALLAEHKPAWVIIDNMRTWCGSMNLDVDSSSSAAGAIDPIAEAIRECDHPVACSILHNEARSKSEGKVVKGVKASDYAPRLRNSTVFEDAADWIVGCAHVDGSTETTITAGEKTRRGIPTETLIIDLSTDGYGTPSTGGGPDDPFTVTTPVNQLDEKINGYLMANPEGVTQRAVLKSLRGPGTRRETVAAHLKVVGTLGPDDLWRCDTGRKSPAEPSHDLVVPEHEITPPEQVLPEAQTGGGENRGTGGVFPVLPTNGNRGGNTTGNVTHPIGGTVPGTLPGNSPGTHLAVPDLVPLAGAKTDTAPTPRGGSSENRPIGPSPILALASSEPDECDVVKHGKDCPGGCGGRGTVDGKPCNWTQREEDRTRQPIEGAPTTHTSGIKKWDDATSTWVDTLPCGDVFMVEGGIVHLSERTTVTDGDPNIHWDMTWTDIELDREDVVDYQ